MKKLIYILIAIMSLNSCMSGQQKDDKKNQITENYTIPDSLYSFFPDNSYDCKKFKQTIVVTNAGKTELPYFAENFAVQFIAKVYLCNDKSYFTSIKDDFSNQSVNRFKSEDSSYFIISSQRHLINKYDTLNLKNEYLDYQVNSLVMSFYSIFSDEPMFYSSFTTCGLPEGYEILVLKSGNEYVLPEKYKYNWSVLPDKLKHGYSSGVAFKETEPYIIYWVVAW